MTSSHLIRRTPGDQTVPSSPASGAGRPSRASACARERRSGLAARVRPMKRWSWTSRERCRSRGHRPAGGVETTAAHLLRRRSAPPPRRAERSDHLVFEVRDARIEPDGLQSVWIVTAADTGGLEAAPNPRLHRRVVEAGQPRVASARAKSRGNGGGSSRPHGDHERAFLSQHTSETRGEHLERDLVAEPLDQDDRRRPAPPRPRSARSTPAWRRCASAPRPAGRAARLDTAQGPTSRVVLAHRARVSQHDVPRRHAPRPRMRPSVGRSAPVPAHAVSGAPARARPSVLVEGATLDQGDGS